MKFIAGLCAAAVISSVGVVAQAPAPPPAEITYIGCLRAWKPATDVTRFPEGKLGMYVLTPIATSSAVVEAVPTYLLSPSQVANFAAHLDDKVEVTGVPQPAPRGRTIGAIIGAPPRPEERPDVDAMPRLTVKTLRKLSDACPS